MVRIFAQTACGDRRNKKKNGDKHPDFKSDGVAVWVNEV